MRYKTITVYDNEPFDIDVEGLSKVAKENPDGVRNFLRMAIQGTRVLIADTKKQYEAAQAYADIGVSVTRIDPHLLSQAGDTSDMNVSAQAQRIVDGYNAIERNVKPETISDERKQYAISLGRLVWLFRELFPNESL